jgi:inositol-1,3,4-trisphosphate 5/6-kinase/inositol-tetrakisphosphate 1-kinase
MHVTMIPVSSKLTISMLIFQMAVIFNAEGVADCKPPCVAQSFISHDAVLYKIYLVGDEHYIVERPSLKNFYPSGKYF